MKFDKNAAFNQGHNDAWADKDPNPQQFKGLEAQLFYRQGYALGRKDVENTYTIELQDQ